MRVDTDDFARPCRCGKEHHIEVREILIEETGRSHVRWFSEAIYFTPSYL